MQLYEKYLLRQLRVACPSSRPFGHFHQRHGGNKIFVLHRKRVGRDGFKSLRKILMKEISLIIYSVKMLNTTDHKNSQTKFDCIMLSHIGTIIDFNNFSNLIV